MKIIYEIGVSTDRVGSRMTTRIEIDPEDLEGIPEDKQDDYVWDKLGGKEAAFEMCNIWMNRVDPEGKS